MRTWPNLFLEGRTICTHWPDPGVRSCTHIQAAHAVRRRLDICTPVRMPPDVATLTYMTHAHTCSYTHARDDTVLATSIVAGTLPRLRFAVLPRGGSTPADGRSF